LLSLALESSSALRPSKSRRLTSLPRVAPTMSPREETASTTSGSGLFHSDFGCSPIIAPQPTADIGWALVKISASGPIPTSRYCDHSPARISTDLASIAAGEPGTRLSSEPPNLEEARAAVDCIAQQGTRASEVVRHIRAMFTKATPERSQVHVNDLIREVGSLVEGAALRNVVLVQTELTEDLPATTGDRVQLQQVIVNLILNGIEAMSDVTDRPRRLVIRSQMQNSDEVLVAVRDSGVGIDPKNEKRIFDAFFTTKDQGMGMGLSISHSIIEAHGGRLWASGNSDYGATLQFTLPATLSPEHQTKS